jgi:hypothetical protein
LKSPFWKKLEIEGNLMHPVSNTENCWKLVKKKLKVHKTKVNVVAILLTSHLLSPKKPNDFFEMKKEKYLLNIFHWGLRSNLGSLIGSQPIIVFFYELFFLFVVHFVKDTNDFSSLKPKFRSANLLNNNQLIFLGKYYIFHLIKVSLVENFHVFIPKIDFLSPDQVCAIIFEVLHISSFRLQE